MSKQTKRIKPGIKQKTKAKKNKRRKIISIKHLLLILLSKKPRRMA